jgi:carbon-monoxide dehydrogenase medium subunit
LLAAKSEQLLIGERPTAEVIRAAAVAATVDIDPSSDIHASGRYRRHLAAVLTRRALAQAFGRASGVPLTTTGSQS